MVPPLLHTYQSRNTILTVWQNMKGDNQKSQFSISFMNLRKARGSTRATIKSPNLQSFCKLGKSLKYRPRPTLKYPNFESKDELRNLCPNLNIFVENKGSLHPTNDYISNLTQWMRCSISLNFKYLSMTINSNWAK